jgi:hypothetical protein
MGGQAGYVDRMDSQILFVFSIEGRRRIFFIPGGGDNELPEEEIPAHTPW